MASTFTEQHEVQLTDAEIEDYRLRVVALDGEIIDAEKAKKDAVDEHSAKIKALKKEHLAKLTAVQTGSEKRDVELQEERDFNLNRVVHRRIDTGEVVFERAMSDSERQEDLFDVEGAEQLELPGAAEAEDEGEEEYEPYAKESR